MSQLGGRRLQGALENAQIKVIFGTGRQTAAALVEELFTPNLEAVKHQVSDEVQRDRTHPAFFSLSEQWERFTQITQRLPRRHILVQLPDQGLARRLRTMTVPRSDVTKEALETLKRDLAQSSGMSKEEMERAIAVRDTDTEPQELEYYEDVEDAQRMDRMPPDHVLYRADDAAGWTC